MGLVGSMKPQEISTESADAATPLIGVLSNPSSTRNQQVMPALRALTDGNARIWHHEIDDVSVIPSVLQTFSDAQVAVVVINGGDGTIQASLSALMNDRPFSTVPPLAILPGGKTNMIAADLGAASKPEKVLAELIDLVAAGRLPEHLVNRHLIELDMGDGAAPRYGMFFGSAGVVRGILWCREKIFPMKLPNFLTHLIAIVGLLASALGLVRNSPLRSGDMKWGMPGKPAVEGQFSLMLATTLDRLLLGFKPFADAGEGGLRFTAIRYGAKGMAAGLWGLVTRRFGRKAEAYGVYSRQADEVVIEGGEPVTLDGEIYFPADGRPVTLRAQKALAFVHF